MNTLTTSQNTASNSKKQRPGELRKEAKRLENSRNNLKEKIRGKSITIKKMNGTLDDTRNSRDFWRKKSEERQREVKELNRKIEQYINDQIKNDEIITSLLEDLKKNNP